MDPMNQSAQISSSQGFADGQNSAAKESKLSDKRTVLSSNKPSEGVATSLRFPSQPSSFPPGKYAKETSPPDVQPDSPIKTSPVSERIKALEALAAKKKEPDFRSDGGYSHFRDRHHEKSPTDNPKFPTETAKSPPETAKSPPETAKSPPETAKSPPETAKSPPETAKSPPETAKSPSQISKYLIEKNTPTTQKRGCSADPESPESPFEIVRDLKQLNEFEETEDWMKAHLPPVPDFDSVGLNKSPDNVPSKEKETDMALPDTSAAFAGVPDAFMDSPIEGPDLKDKLGDGQKQSSLEEEFDLRFLPTAYMCDQQEKSAFQAPSNPDPLISSSPAPPVGFESASPLNVSPADTDVKQNVSEENTSWTTDTELPEASEADSSGESDDTVIEDGVGTPASAPALSSESPVSNDPTVEKETPPVKSERKLMQVPTINVIETDEPNLSDEEMEIELEAEEDDEYEVVKDPYGEAPKSLETESDNTEPLKTRPLETEFMEGYSPPSSPVDSDHEYSPKHNTMKSNPISPESQPKPEAQANSIISKDFDSDNSQAAESHTLSKKTIKEPSTFTITNEDEDLPDNDEWSAEARNILVKPYQTEHVSEEPVSIPQSTVYEKSNTEVRLSETNFIQDDIYDRQSFDYDYDASSPFEDIDNNGLPNAKERFLTDHASLEQKDVAEDSHSLNKATSLNDDEDFSAQPCQTKYSQDSNSCFQSKTPSTVNEQEYNMKGTVDRSSDKVKDDTTGSKVQQDAKTAHHAPDKTGKPEGNADSEPEPETDSFVDFMRECLKSRHDEGPGCLQQGGPSKNEDGGPSLTHSQSPPSMVMNLEQEQLTIAALKQLGSSQEEEEDEAAAIVNLQSSKDLDQDRANPGTTTHQSSIASITISPCAQSNRVLDNAYSKEVEAIDEWVAEAYHLAEHVLTAVLTHLSVKDLIHWRDPKKSGVVFGLSLLLLLSLAAFSVISVASYLLLALLCVTITFRIYKSVVQAVQKSNDGHPFKSLIDKDVSIPPETFRKNVDASLTYINRGLKQMSRLFLVEDLVDSLKLAVVMWLLTYVGAVFNGITILILADILLFAVPPVYEKNKTQIDQYIDLARTQINSTMAKLQDKLPGAVKRNKTE